MYNGQVKRRDLVKRLGELGWQLLREGGNHSVFGKGDERLAVPRHAEVNENTARGILRVAKGEK